MHPDVQEAHRAKGNVGKDLNCGFGNRMEKAEKVVLEVASANNSMEFCFIGLSLLVWNVAQR